MSFGGLVYYAEKFTAWNISKANNKQDNYDERNVHTVVGYPCVGCCSIGKCKYTWCNAHPLRYKV